MRAQVDDFAWPGATVLRSVPSGTQVVPYWDTPAFDNLTVGEGWDLVFIMLGEYDALTKASGFPVDIWPSEGCGTPGLMACCGAGGRVGGGRGAVGRCTRALPPEPGVTERRRVR